MFEGAEYPQSLDESTLERWFEQGRSSRIPYTYLVIIWDDRESSYSPVFLEERVELDNYSKDDRGYSNQWFVAAYDLFSESRVK